MAATPDTACSEATTEGAIQRKPQEPSEQPDVIEGIKLEVTCNKLERKTRRNTP